MAFTPVAERLVVDLSFTVLRLSTDIFVCYTDYPKEFFTPVETFAMHSLTFAVMWKRSLLLMKGYTF